MSKLKAEEAGALLLAPAEQVTSLGLRLGPQVPLGAAPLWGLHCLDVRDWLEGGWLVSANLTPGRRDAKTHCPGGRPFGGWVGCYGPAGPLTLQLPRGTGKAHPLL